MKLQDFIIQWFCIIFGDRRAVDELMHDFLRTCVEYEGRHERFKTFLNLSGMHINDGRIVPVATSKKEYLREMQFESTDTLLMYLRFILCIRLNASPYLPDISEENREEKGSVVNYNEAKLVWLSLINETSHEHGLTEDNFKDLDSI